MWQKKEDFQGRKRKQTWTSQLISSLYRESNVKEKKISPDESFTRLTKSHTDSYKVFKYERQRNSLQEPVNHGVSPSHDVVSTDRNKLTDTQTIKKKLSRPISVCCYNVCTHHKCLLICFFFTESLAPSVKTKSNSSDESHARRMRKTTKAGPSGAASRSRLKPLPHRPPPHIPNVSRWMLAGSKQEREPHATCRAQLSTRKKKSPKDCAFRLQWRHSSRFIKSVLFRFQRDFTFKKVLGKEGSRGGFVEKRGFFIPFAS